MQRQDGTTVDFQADNYDIFKLGQEDLRRVRQIGTDPALRSGEIQLYGYYVSA
jgi:hypothetical protein